MHTFNQRSITTQKTLGERLSRERLARGWSIEDVAEALHIKAAYIQALEESKYTKLPSAVFVKNYVRNYAKLLRISVHEIEEQLDKELQVYTPKPEIPTLRGYLAKHPLHVWRLVSMLLAGALVLAVGMYVVLEVSSISQPPEIVLEEIPQRVTSGQPFITVAGTTQPEATVRINQQNVAVKPDGSFSQNIALQDGANVLTIASKTKRSKENIIYKQVFVGDALTDEPN